MGILPELTDDQIRRDQEKDNFTAANSDAWNVFQEACKQLKTNSAGAKPETIDAYIKEAKELLLYNEDGVPGIIPRLREEQHDYAALTALIAAEKNNLSSQKPPVRELSSKYVDALRNKLAFYIPEFAKLSGLAKT